MGYRAISAAAFIAFATMASAAVKDAPDTPEPTRTAENYSTAKAVSGKPLQLGTHASVTKDCTSGPLPVVRILIRPQNGTLTVRRGSLTGGQIGDCRNLNIPVQGVFYASRPGYVGTDHLSYDVFGSDGQIERYDITISVVGSD